MPDANAPSAGSPLASVVVPVLNGAGVVGECVRSLLAVSYPRERFEIVMVDNGSVDETRSILATFGDAVRVIPESRRGAAAARNRGIRESRGKIVAFIDADCVVHRDWLAEVVKPLDDPAVGVVGGPVLSRRPANRVELFGEHIHDQRAAIESFDQPYVITGNWASRRDVLMGAGLFDESLLRGQDADLAWRLHRAGYRFTFAPDAVVYHRNERTLRGLVREGFQHGAASVVVHDKFIALGSPLRRTGIAARTLRDLRAMLKSPGVDATLQLLFDLGKSAGEVAGVMRSRHRRPQPWTPAPTRSQPE